MPAPKKKTDDSYKDFVMDALSDLEGLRSKSMFGGVGLYAKDIFFGIIWKGRSYFRVDDASRPEYEGRGSKPFVYSRDGVSTTMSYFEVPAEILEDHEGLRRWAERAVEASRSAKSAKKKRKK